MGKRVVIIGGGAAGCACAVTLSRLNFNGEIIIIERGARIGRKIAASGNGQGNVSNANMDGSHYFGSVRKYANSILPMFNPGDLFSCLFTTDETGRIYPSCRQASSLTDSLLFELISSSVQILLNETAEKIEKADMGFVVSTTLRKLPCDYVILCCGGKAQKQFGTDGTGYALAEALGHTKSALYPSLVQLKTDRTYIKTLKGIRSECKVKVCFNGQITKETRGDVIFTDYGVSGNAIFYLSAYVSGKQGASLSIEFLPDKTKDEIDEFIKKKKASGYPEEELLCGAVHNQIGRAIIRRAKDSGEEISAVLKDFRLDVTGTMGYDYAQVTKGGIGADEITKSLESRIVPHLFFAGEVLDIDGECGGYNLHFAFASGICVAEKILCYAEND